jgi:hypothetical protein
MLFLMQVAPPTALLHLPRSFFLLLSKQVFSFCRAIVHGNHNKWIQWFIFLPFQTHSFVDHAVQVVHEEFGIVEGLMTTVHATTGSLLVVL